MNNLIENKKLLALNIISQAITDYLMYVKLKLGHRSFKCTTKISETYLYGKDAEEFLYGNRIEELINIYDIDISSGAIRRELCNKVNKLLEEKDEETIKKGDTDASKQDYRN